MKKIAVLTSGGDSPGMNAAVRAVVRKGISLGMEVYGIQRGFEGLLDGEIEKMEWYSVGDIIQRGGTILRTARSKRFLTKECQDHAVKILETFGIEGLIIIGGDGSFNGGIELIKRGVNVVGVPATIDNDLGYTDYTIGFDTAVNTILSLISNIRDTSSAHERTTIIEVMGRHCGDVTLNAGIAGGADVILIPEVEFDFNEICRKVLRGQQSGKLHSLILKSEGVPISTDELAKQIQDRTGREARPIIPSHIQRGGTPTSNDRIRASLMGAKAVELLYYDIKNKAVGINGTELVSYDMETALNMKREFDENLFNLANTLA